MGVKINCKFELNERVHIDEDKSITAVVTQICFNGGGVQYEVQWFNNGSLQEKWVYEFRISKMEE